MSKNVLVTGAAGFIGANFAEYFVNKHPDYNVIVLDKLTYAGNLDNLKKVMDKITFVQGDICDFDLVLDLFKKYDPMTVRYFIEQFHYRSNVDFSDDGLSLAEKQFAKLKESVNSVRAITTNIDSKLTNQELIDIYNNFVNAMNEDFNTPLAMVELNKIMKVISNAIKNNLTEIYPQINYVVSAFAEQVLGLDFGEVDTQQKVVEIPNKVKELANLRWEAKQNKNWAKSDELRDEIKALGYVILDRKDGYDIELLNSK